MVRFFKYSLLVMAMLAIKSCDKDETISPSIDNDFLGQDFFSYSFDGQNENWHGERIFYDSRFPERPYDFYNLMGSSLGGVNPIKSAGYSVIPVFWFPIYDSVINTIKLPFTNTSTSINNSPSFNKDFDNLFKLDVKIDTEYEWWFSIDSLDWPRYSEDDYELNNYNIIKSISLIDTTWSDINRYKIEGEFKSILRENGSTRLKPATGKYRIELLLHK